MSGGSPNHGVVDSYDGMTPIPVISYNPTKNALVINNPVQANEGIASAESETLDFNSPATFNNIIRVGYNGDFPASVPMTSPLDPTSLILPAINSVGMIQAIELVIANDGTARLYAGKAGRHINGDITVVGNITNTNLQDQLNLKAPLHDPTFTGIVGGLSKAIVNLANVDNTTDLNKPISTATQTAKFKSTISITCFYWRSFNHWNTGV